MQNVGYFNNNETIVVFVLVKPRSRVKALSHLTASKGSEASGLPMLRDEKTDESPLDVARHIGKTVIFIFVNTNSEFIRLKLSVTASSSELFSSDS